MATFPSRFDESATVNEVSELQRQSLLYLDLIVARDNEDEELMAKLEKDIRVIDDYLISLDPPMMFNGKDDIVSEMTKGFERLLFIMEQEGVNDPKKLSVYEFYARVDFIEHQNKPSK